MDFGIIFGKLVANILFAIYRFLDTVFSLFQVLVGVEKVNAAGYDNGISLTELFFSGNVLTTSFLMIFILSIVIAVVSVILAIVRNIINLKVGERKSQFVILGQGAFAIGTSLIMAVVMFVGIMFANTALVLVYKATAGEDADIKLSARLFDMCVESTYILDYSNPITAVQENITYAVDENGKLIPDGNGGYKIETVDYVIVTTYHYKRDDNGQPMVESGYWENRGVEDIDFDTQNADDIFGIHQKDWLGLFEQGDQGYTQDPIVRLESFNLLLACLTACVIIVAIVWSMLGLVKRVFDLVMLFLALPLISATIPLDDGARFKAWRDAVISKVVLAFGAVLAINVFILLTTQIALISIEGVSPLMNSIFKMFLLMGGALSISGGQLLFARLMGASAEEGREMMQAARTTLAGLGVSYGLARGAKNMVFGGFNKYGRMHQGLIPMSARVGNWMAEKAGGQAYTGSRVGSVMRFIGRTPSPQQRGVNLTNTLANTYSNAGSVGNTSAGGGAAKTTAASTPPVSYLGVSPLRGPAQSNAFDPSLITQTQTPTQESGGQNSSLAKETTSQQIRSNSGSSNKGGGA